MFALNGALFGVWAARIPAIADRLALDEAALGLVLLCLAGGAVLAFPVAGWACDRFGAAPVTRAIAGAYALALPLLALAPSPMLLALALTVFGALHGAMDVTMNAWGAEVERSLPRPAMPFFHAMFSVGAGVGALTGAAAGWLGAAPQAHFVIVAGVLWAAAAWLAAAPWETPRGAARRGPVLAMPRGALLPVALVAFCGAFGEGAMADWSAVYLATVLATDEGAAALGYAVFSTAMVATRLAGAGLIARLGAAGTVAASGAVALIGAVTLLAAVAAPMALAGFGLLGIGLALVMPLAFSRAAAHGEPSPGAAIAAVATLGYGGMLLGPPVMGFIAAALSLRVAMAVVAVLAVVVLCLSLRFRDAA
jgi:MFS family permease